MVTYSNKFGKQLRIKRILSVFLVFAMVLSMLPLASLQAHAASEVTVKVSFTNNKNWSGVSVYAAEGDSWSLLTGSFPGDALAKNSAGYYVYEVTKSTGSSLNLVFNDGTNNNANKTRDCIISAATLAAEKDGLLEVWIDGDSNILYTAPADGPTVTGNMVTFSYYNTSATQVYLAGSMNGWSTTANKMTNNSSGIFTCTIELAPGVYEYKFVVDGAWVADPSNSNVTGDTGNSAVIVSGLLDTTISVKKGAAIELPSELAYISKSGETFKDVTYTSVTEGVSVNGLTVTLAEDFEATSFTVNATSTDDETATATVTVQIYELLDTTVKIHYDRSDDAESDWNVWIWSDNAGGKAYEFELVDGEYIATYTISAKDSIYTSSINYIIRKGEWVSQEATRTVDLSNVLAGTVHSYVKTDGTYENDTSKATLGTKLNSIDYNRSKNEIVVTASGVVANPEASFVLKRLDGTAIDITGIKTTGTAYTLSIGEDISSIMMITKTYILTYDGNEYLVTMPNVYTTDEFEAEYTYTGNDLGATWYETETVFRVWAPTADNVKVQLYATGSDNEEGSAKLGTYTMLKDVNGTWLAIVSGDLNGVYYTYLTEVNGEVEESCDPYARTTGVNGKRAMVLDLDSTDPEGWEDDISPNAGMSYTDAMIYELHIRDLSINAESGIKDEWKGKFLGLTQKGTTNSAGIATGLDHIKDLGVTHIHLLPIYDYASIDETMTEAEKSANPSKQFNWGYDPENYNVPEGSYSTNPYDGATRVAEMKEMVQTLHENNLNVIMDVVYNHVYDAGNFCFNEIVPNYFSRTNADGSYSNGSGCGNDTASERAMVRKYIVDSVKYWADEYHIDGFRFDLVGLLDAETINLVVDEVHKTHPDVIFYGEGWTMGTAVEPSDTVMATQKNASKTPYFAYFSDTFRDFLKGKNDEVTWGYVQGATEGDQEGTLMECFTANTSWIGNPTQVINYASCHDNYTLMDKLNITKGSSSLADRIKMNNLAAAIYLTAEGIPLIHAGEEMLRTKVDSNGNIIHNSYNSPDYINSLKWGDLDSKDYQNVRDYYKGLIEFRKNHAALRLTSKTEVNNNVTSLYFDDNVVGFKINGKSATSDEVADEILIIFNSNNATKTISLADHDVSLGTWNICVNDVAAGTDVLGTITNGQVTVPAISALVLVKGETVDTDSVYTRNAVIETGKVNIEYVDEEGNVLASEQITGNVGTAYSTTAILIDGYVLKTTPENASGEYTSADIFVTYVYVAQQKEKLNGLCKANDGNWYYYVDGVVDTSYTGIVKNSKGWWYVAAGKLDFTYTGMAKNSKGWWYITNGKLDLTYTGMAKNSKGWWYMTNGKLDLTYTGMATNQYGAWYMTNGKLNTTVTGLVKTNLGWIYLTKGKLDTSVTGLVKNKYGWWYVKDGKLDRTYTGFAENKHGAWYVKNGYLDMSVTGLTKTTIGWVYLTKGMLDATYTGMVQNNKGWWYVKEGKLDWSYTGFVTDSNGTWYVTEGRHDTSITGMIKNGSTWLYMVNGKQDTTYTGMAKNKYGWWHMTNGELDLTYTGISTNKYGMWYVNNGKLDLTFTGEATYKGVTYNVVDGKVVES